MNADRVLSGLNVGAGYRGRLAPSPTGLLHLGHARTFGICALRAHESAGTLVLRDDDLDPLRALPAYSAAMLDDLRWLGIEWTEGPDLGGPHAPYRQRSRRSHYLLAWQQLVEQGWIYPCRCSRRELREAQALQAGVEEDEDDEPLYPGTCRPAARTAPPGAPRSPAGVNWRFRVPAGETISFIDEYSGRHHYLAGRDFGDFLVWRREDVAAYQLACVVDDAAMGITEVVRGADLLKSTARQLLLYQALNLAPPAWFHCPLVLDAQGNRLAKRAGALSIRALREAGHTAAQVLAMSG